MASYRGHVLAAAVEALHSSRCQEPGCQARYQETEDAITVLDAVVPLLAGSAMDPLQQLANAVGGLGEDIAMEGSRPVQHADLGDMLERLAARIRDGA
jgi:hypothetical protein